MATSIKENFKIGLAISLLCVGAFWWNMEDYQKDRVTTVVVRSAITLVDQERTSETVDVVAAEEGLEPPTQ